MRYIADKKIILEKISFESSIFNFGNHNNKHVSYETRNFTKIAFYSKTENLKAYVSSPDDVWACHHYLKENWAMIHRPTGEIMNIPAFSLKKQLECFADILAKNTYPMQHIAWIIPNSKRIKILKNR